MSGKRWRCAFSVSKLQIEQLIIPSSTKFKVPEKCSFEHRQPKRVITVGHIYQNSLKPSSNSPGWEKMRTFNVQEYLFGKKPIHWTTLISSPNFHTNSYISATVHHTNPYIKLAWPVVLKPHFCTFLYTDNFIFCIASFRKKKQSAKTNKA